MTKGWSDHAKQETVARELKGGGEREREREGDREREIEKKEIQWRGRRDGKEKVDDKVTQPVGIWDEIKGHPSRQRVSDVPHSWPAAPPAPPAPLSSSLAPQQAHSNPEQHQK